MEMVNINDRNTPAGENSYIKCDVVKAKVYVDKYGVKRIEEIKND